jgi:hypothetical protein
MSKTPAAQDPVGDLLALAQQVNKDAVALFGAADPKHLQKPYPEEFFRKRAALVDSGRALEGAVEKLLAGGREDGPADAGLRYALECLQADVSQLVEITVAWKEEMHDQLTQAVPEVFQATVACAVREVRCQRDQLARSIDRVRGQTGSIQPAAKYESLVRGLRNRYPRWKWLERDLYFLRLADEEGLGPAAIRDRCRSEHEGWKLKGGHSGREVVEGALKKTRQKIKESGLSA